MGVGKSPALLQAVSDLLLFGETDRVLILAPKRVAQSTWPGEIQKFKSSFGHMSLAVAIGDANTRHAAIRSGAQITTCNFENLVWLVENYGESGRSPMIIVDEATRISGLRVSIQTSKLGRSSSPAKGVPCQGARSRGLEPHVTFCVSVRDTGPERIGATVGPIFFPSIRVCASALASQASANGGFGRYQVPTRTAAGLSRCPTPTSKSARSRTSPLPSRPRTTLICHP